MNSTVIISAMDYIGKSSWLSILAFAIGIIGILIGIYTLLGKKEKSPRYAITSNNIIRDFVSVFKPLEIKYSNQEIKNFTITKIVFWNNGRETINKEDVVNADPISIHIKDGYNILDKEIIGKNENTNNFSLEDSADKSSFNIEFDYIDKHNGIVIQILHTGKSSDDIEFCGRIKGVGKTRLYDLKLKDELEGWGIFSGFIILCILAQYLPQYLPILFTGSLYHDILSIFIMSLVFFIFLILILFVRNKIDRLPKGLEVFKEDITNVNHQHKIPFRPWFKA